MALTATYDPTLSRIRLAADALGATATYAFMWRALTVDNFHPFITIRGGDRVPVVGGVLQMDDYEFPAGQSVQYQVASFNAGGVQQAGFTSNAITADLDSVWIKVVARPFLNRPVIVQSRGPVTRPARGGVFDVVGRSFPVSVSDVRGSRRFLLSVLTNTGTEADDMDALLASGEPVFVHVPSGETKLRGGYFTIGDTAEEPIGRRSVRRIFDLPLIEVAAPDDHVVGAAGTWQTVLNTYANWTEVINDNLTWSDLLELVGDPSEVIVP